MKFRLLLVTLACCLQFASYAQYITNPNTVQHDADPLSGGFAPDRMKRIDKFLQAAVDSGKMNGAVALIVRNGQLAYFQSVGYTDAEKKTQIKKDAIFRMASQTKAITSVAVMMLYEEGEFMLDDPISKFIPEFAKPKVIDKFNLADSTYTTIPAKREVTIRDLLTHTSGLGYAQIGSKEAVAMYAKAGIVAGISVGNAKLGTVIRKLGTLPLMHQPGERFTYGLNTDVLGYLVELASGMSLAEFFRQRIFEPLNMKDTYFYLPKEKQNRLIPLFTEDAQTGKAVVLKRNLSVNGDLDPEYPNSDGSYYSGGGGLSGTIRDYAIFLQMLLNGGEFGGKRILARNTVRMMTSNQIGELNQGGKKKFGLGFSLTTLEASAILPTPEGVFEWGGMFATTYWVDPKEKMVALIYRNIYPTHFGNIADYFKVLVYSAMN